jgi:hypothetical protein
VIGVVPDAERKYVHEKVEVHRRKTLKLSDIKYFKMTIRHFFEKIISKNETVIMFLEIHTHHEEQIKKVKIND